MAQHVGRPGWLHVFFAVKTPSRSNQRLAAMLKECFGVLFGRFCNVENCQSVLLHRLRFYEIMFRIVFKRTSRTQNTTLSN